VALLFALVHVGVQRYVGYGASEAPTWILMPASIAFLIGSNSRAAWAAGSALLGVLVALRLECLPVALMLWLLFASLPGRRAERIALAGGGLVLTLGAIVLHNVVYGSEFALVRAEPVFEGRKIQGTESGISALGNIVPALWDPAARATLLAHVEAILYLPFDTSLTAENLAQRLPFHALLLAWLAAAGFVTLRWRQTTWIAKGITALPLAAFVPFLAFDVTTYYPRQIVLGYVAMGVATIYVLGRGRRSQPRPAESGEAGPPAAGERAGRAH
jgi:hypothetical protein